MVRTLTLLVTTAEATCGGWWRNSNNNLHNRLKLVHTEPKASHADS